MNEELDSQLSAMFDDELPEGECQLLARRLSRDEALKARWRRYAVMGAAVRVDRNSRMEVRLETNLATRVSAAISAEPALEGNSVATATTRRRGSFRWWQPVVGGSIAAGVAAMSVLWVRAQSPIGSDELVAQNASPTTVVAQNSVDNATASGEPEGYVVPLNVEPRSTLLPAELANYMVAHSEYSTPVTRRFPLATLVGTQSDAGESDDPQDQQTVPVEDPVENADKTH